METEKLAEKLSPILRTYWLSIIFGFLGLILLGYGLIGLTGSKSSDDFVLDKSSQTNSSSPDIGNKIVIDIEGAVVAAGVYELGSNSRMKDLLVKAGGLSKEADREWIAKNLNLASKLTDGGKIYIPFEGEQGMITTSVAGASTQSTGLININSASQSQLDSLPGVGPVTSNKIIQNRPYSTVDDLLKKKVVGNKVFSQIKDKISAF